jgi:uncharacterized protein (TIGR03083 family)
MHLASLLRNLTTAEWALPTACPGWSVHDVASHLLGIEAGNVSVRRDEWRLAPKQDDDPDAWLNEFNGQWVAACRRLSPKILLALLELAAADYEEYVLTLDGDGVGGPVLWATGDAPAPVWLDLAREYMERFVHQQQIREAVSSSPLEPEFAAAAIATAVHALPVALQRVRRPSGTTVRFRVEGPAGGTWFAVRNVGSWELQQEPGAEVTCDVRTSVEGALKLLVRDPSAPPLAFSGDPDLAAAVANAKAVLG